MEFRDILRSLDQLDEATKEVKGGRVHTAEPGGYGRQDDDDEDEDGKKIKTDKPAGEKRGRGRPPKEVSTRTSTGADAGNKKYSSDSLQKAMGIGKPSGKAKVTTKHKTSDKEPVGESMSLKGWFDKLDKELVNETGITVKPMQGASQIIGADGKPIGTADMATANVIKAASEKGTLKLAGEEQMAEAMPASDSEIDSKATQQYAQKIVQALQQATGATVKGFPNQDGTVKIVINPVDDGTYPPTRGYIVPTGNDGATMQNINKAIDPYYYSFRQKGWRFDQPVGGAFTIGIPTQQAVEEGDVGKHNNATTGFAALVKKLTPKYGKEAATKIAGAQLKKIKEAEAPQNFAQASPLSGGGRSDTALESKGEYAMKNKQGVAEGLKQTLRRFDPTIKARIRDKSQDQTNQGLDTIQHLADLDLTSDDMVSRAMKPNTYFKNAERYAKLANKGVAEATSSGTIKEKVRKALLRHHGEGGTVRFSKTGNGGFFAEYESEFGDTYSHQYDPVTGKIEPYHISSSYYVEAAQALGSKGVAEGRMYGLREGMEHNLKAAYHEGKSHGLANQAYNCRHDDMEESRMYHEGYKQGLDECHGQIPIRGLVGEMGPGSEVDDMASFGADTLDEVSRGEWIKQQARKPGDTFKAFGQTMHDSDVLDEFAFESLDSKLSAILEGEEVAEGMTVSISKGQQGAPDSVSVSAQDGEADQLLSIIKSAGLGLFGGEEKAGYGAPQGSTQAPGGIEVVDDHDGMMALMKKLTGQDIGAESSSDYEDEEGHEGHSHEEGSCNECGYMESQCKCDKEVVDEEEDEVQQEFEVDEANAPDSGADNTDADVAGNAATNSALATADAGADEEEGQVYSSPVSEESDAEEDDKAEEAGEEVKKDIEYDDEKDKVDESYANSADDTFEADIDFMTNIISGGLNKRKQTGQTTIPVLANQVNRTVSIGVTDVNESRMITESVNDWKKLAGIQ